MVKKNQILKKINNAFKKVLLHREILLIITLLTLIIISISLIALFYHVIKNDKNSDNNNKSNISPNTITQQQQQPDYVGGTTAPKPPLTDSQALYSNNRSITTPFNTPTQGEANSFVQIGTLSNNSDKILPLYGRRLHNGSQQWNYYISNSSDGVQLMRLGFEYKGRDCMAETPGCDELNTGDVVNIPEYDSDFTVKRYNNQQFRYIG